MRRLAIACLLLALAACKEPFPHYCDETTPCTDPARSYCDLTGAHNDGAGNICIPSPFDAGVFDAGQAVDAGPDAAVGPQPPRLLSPRNGYYTGSVHADTPLRPTFRWRPVTGVSGYEIELDDSCPSTDFAACDFPSPEVSEATTDPRFTPSDPLPVSTSQPVGARYFWRVRACDADGCGGWSPVRYLHVGRQKNDYDGDGYADIVVGARRQDGAELDSGMAFLYFGKPAWTPGATVQSEDLRLPDPSPRAGGYYGWSVSALGDVNSDGYADLAVASIPQDTAGAESRVDIYLGHQDMRTAPSEVVSLHSPGGQTDTLFGFRISGGCDIDADGHGDLIVAAAQSNPESKEGVAFVYLGKRLWPSSVAEADVVIDNPRDQADTAFGLATCGDIDGDGTADVIASALLMDNPEASEGTTFVYFGRPSWPTEVGTADVEIDGPLDYPAGLFGSALAAGEDVNGDGYEDLAIGGHEIGNPEPGEGALFLYFGRDVWQGVLQTADVTIDNPTDTPGGNFAMDVDLGDVDGDGIADVVTGAKNNGAGLGYIYPGTGGWPANPTPAVSMADPLDEVGNEFAETLAAGGDLNGDGIADVLLGAFRGLNPEENEGNVFLWLGRATWPAADPPISATFDNPDDEISGEFGCSLE